MMMEDLSGSFPGKSDQQPGGLKVIKSERGSLETAASTIRDGDRLDNIRRRVARIEDTLRSVVFRQGATSVTDSSAVPCTDHPPNLLSLVKKEIAARQNRHDLIRVGLFADPAWDMLLDLFSVQLQDGLVSISSLTIASQVPMTTALRYIRDMERTGEIERFDDPFDRRRKYLKLSDRTFVAMRDWFLSK